jgi:hypothetical protein
MRRDRRTALCPGVKPSGEGGGVHGAAARGEDRGMPAVQDAIEGAIVGLRFIMRVQLLDHLGLNPHVPTP